MKLLTFALFVSVVLANKMPSPTAYAMVYDDVWASLKNETTFPPDSDPYDETRLATIEYIANRISNREGSLDIVYQRDPSVVEQA